MRLLVAGSSGLLGSRLVETARADGHEVVRLVRSGGTEPGTSLWDPYEARLDRGRVEWADVVVNLAGSPLLGNVHSQKWARELERSRVTTTRVLAEAIALSESRPAFLAGNGISCYGDRGATPVDEAATTQTETLLGRVTEQWQQATAPVADAGGRVCVLRTAPVLDRRSPPMKMLAPLFRLGGGGPLGSGDQYFPVITTRDWVGAVLHLARSEVRGPVNLCLPRTPTNAAFTRALAREVRRPAFARVPARVLRLAAGPMAPELLGSVRAVPQVLQDSGYTFQDPDVVDAVRQALHPE